MAPGHRLHTAATRGCDRGRQAQPVDHRCEAHLTQQAGGQAPVIVRGGFARDPASRRQRSARQRQRNTVAGERGDHRRLIAKAEQTWPDRAGLGHGYSRKADRRLPMAGRATERRLRVARAGCGHASVSASSRLSHRPAAARTLPPAAEHRAPPDPPPRVAIRHSHPGTAPVRHGGAAPRAAGHRAVVHLASHQARAAIGALRSAQLVLASGDEHRIGIDSPKRCAVDAQGAANLSDRRDAMTAQHRGAVGRRPPQQRLIQDAARQPARGERQTRGRDAVPMHQAQRRDRAMPRPDRRRTLRSSRPPRC